MKEHGSVLDKFFLFLLLLIVFRFSLLINRPQRAEENSTKVKTKMYLIQRKPSALFTCGRTAGILLVIAAVTGCRSSKQGQPGVTGGTEMRERPGSNHDTGGTPNIEGYSFSDAEEKPVTLEKALKKRRSIRSFSQKDISMDTVRALAWSAQGISSPRGLRTCASAGATYPLELYVAMESGLYHYLPSNDSLKKQSGRDLRHALARASLGQMAVASAPAVFIFAAVYERTSQRYGGRAERYVHMEVGHCAQNLALAVAALDLASFPIGAFDDSQVHRVLDLPSAHRPLYIVPVGHPEQ